MQMDLHQDPRHLPQISVLQAEIRKRIWATIRGIAVQAALDAGMPALISFDNFNTELPSNIDDNDIDETTTLPCPKPRAFFTVTLLQMFRSLRTRIGVVRLINGIYSEPPYEDVLRLGSETATAFRKFCNLMQAQVSSDMNQKPTPTAFQRNLPDCSSVVFCLLSTAYWLVKPA